ncbi:MAG: hypothetical protein QM676_08530 [Novosphingobium sp.]
MPTYDTDAILNRIETIDSETTGLMKMLDRPRDHLSGIDWVTMPPADVERIEAWEAGVLMQLRLLKYEGDGLIWRLFREEG